MTSLIRCVKADFYKIKHTPILWIHVIIPVLCSVLFLAYFDATNYDTFTKISAYLEVLAISFPLLIGLICSMIVLQEEQAGSFYELLGRTKQKSVTFLSKIILAILMATLSVFIAVGLFGIGLRFILKEEIIPFSFYLQIGAILILANMFLYILHMVVSFQFGRGASIGLGVAGTLVSALMITGLGDKYWQYIPWAWGVRLCDFIILKEINTSYYSIINVEAINGTTITIVASCFALVISFLWFKYWEGRKCYE